MDYLRYSGSVETIAPGEAQTIAAIIETMSYVAAAAGAPSVRRAA